LGKGVFENAVENLGLEIGKAVKILGLKIIYCETEKVNRGKYIKVEINTNLGTPSPVWFELILSL